MIKQRNIHKDYRLYGVFASAAAFVAAKNKDAEEGDGYYDTTINQLRTHDGTGWSPAGMSTASAGGLNNAASIGNKITIDGSIISTQVEIECSDNGLASGALLLLDNNDVTNDPVCLDIDNAADVSTAVSIDIDGAAGYDIQGTSDSWNVTIAGVISGSGLTLLTDDNNISLGTSTDMTISFHDGAVGTAGNGMLIQGTAAVEQIQIGDATYEVDVLFIGDTATTNFMRWDANGGAGSVGALVFDNADLDLGDGDLIRLGDGTDLIISATGTTATAKIAAGSIWNISDTDNAASRVVFGLAGGTHGLDVYLNTITSGEDIIFDAAAKTLTLDNVDIILQDNDLIAFGDASAEGSIQSDATDMIITTGTGKNVIVTGGAILGEQETVTTGSPTLKSHGATNLDSSGGAITGTLGSPAKTSSAVGQMKTIVMIDATTSSTISITNHQTSDPEVATFDAIDETWVGLWTGTEWVTIFATCTFV